MDLFDSLILGIIEGITEFLPISSTGHLILASNLLGLHTSEFLKSFEIIIQLGAISSVIVLYFKSFLNIETIKRLLASFVPTAVIGFTFYKVVKTYLLGNEFVVILSLFIGGILIILFELKLKSANHTNDPTIRPDTISYKHSFVLGLYQALAIIPGVSRSASTILGGLVLKIPRPVIVEYSFLLAVPTMLGASALDILKSYKTILSPSNLDLLIVGFLVSFFVALLSIKFLLAFIRKYSFIPFGVYRIILAAVFYIFILY